MISAYTNQSLTWKHVSSINEYNEPTYATSIIKGRKETGFKMIRDAQGQETVSSAQVFTKSAVAVNDKIDDKLVIAVDSQITLNGSISFYEVYLI
jgi:hypothetical protein